MSLCSLRLLHVIPRLRKRNSNPNQSINHLFVFAGRNSNTLLSIKSNGKLYSSLQGAYNLTFGLNWKQSTNFFIPPLFLNVSDLNHWQASILVQCRHKQTAIVVSQTGIHISRCCRKRSETVDLQYKILGLNLRYVRSIHCSTYERVETLD